MSDPGNNNVNVGVNKLYEKHGVEPIPTSQSPDNPDLDIPPCDNCGEEWTGKLQCSQCQMVFYCSRKCQKIAWKHGGHKQQCETLRTRCEETSKMIVDTLADTDIFCNKRAHHLQDLAGTSIYKCARDRGLDGVIQQLFQEDYADVLDRYRDGNVMSFTQWIMTVLFRGARCEGHQMGKGSFAHMDGYRCKAYVKSHPDAFADWFRSSMTVITAFLEPSIARDEETWANAMRNSRDVVAGWSMTLANPKVAQAIILGRSRQADDTAKEQALWMAKLVKAALAKFWSAPRGLDVSISIERHMNQMAAMLLLRLEEYQVWEHDNRNKFMKLLGIKQKIKKSLFLDMGIPMGEIFIRKGRSANMEEAREVLRGTDWQI